MSSIYLYLIYAMVVLNTLSVWYTPWSVWWYKLWLIFTWSVWWYIRHGWSVHYLSDIRRGWSIHYLVHILYIICLMIHVYAMVGLYIIRLMIYAIWSVFGKPFILTPCFYLGHVNAVSGGTDRGGGGGGVEPPQEDSSGHTPPCRRSTQSVSIPFTQFYFYDIM